MRKKNSKLNYKMKKKSYSEVGVYVNVIFDN